MNPILQGIIHHHFQHIVHSTNRTDMVHKHRGRRRSLLRLARCLRADMNTEKTLKALLQQQRAKAEEVKNKTNHHSTKSLLERYDDPSGSPLHHQVSAGQLRTVPTPGTPPPRLPLQSIGTPPATVADALNSQFPRTYSTISRRIHGHSNPHFSSGDCCSATSPQAMVRQAHRRASG